MTDQLIPGLLTPHREKVRKRVRDTSRAVYAEARERFTGRRADVLQWLAHHWNAKQEWPTSAELAVWPTLPIESWTNQTAHLLYVRRGLSDLQTAGVVESAGKRTCRVTGKLCHTWRVVQR